MTARPPHTASLLDLLSEARALYRLAGSDRCREKHAANCERLVRELAVLERRTA